MRSYEYVGPAEIKEAVADEDTGVPVTSADALATWAGAQDEWSDGVLTVTFVVTPDRTLRVAPRRSEHVACAGGGAVLAAGELTICREPELAVVEASNQSTGYCPEPDCWLVAREALTRLGIPCPPALTFSCTFRLCEGCGQRNLVKDEWYECDACGRELPREWNFVAT